MTKIDKDVVKHLKYLGWNLGYMLRQYSKEARQIVLKELNMSMKCCDKDERFKER